MGKVICEKCGTEYKFDIAKNFESCPVCGASFSDDGDSAEEQREKTKWYYYKGITETLTTTLYDDEEPLYTFNAVDMQDAERQLKEVLPNSTLLNDDLPEKVRCPRCRSTDIQLAPRKYSLLTGFATNKYDRVCVRCQKRF